MCERFVSRREVVFAFHERHRTAQYYEETN